MTGEVQSLRAWRGGQVLAWFCQQIPRSPDGEESRVCFAVLLQNRPLWSVPVCGDYCGCCHPHSHPWSSPWVGSTSPGRWRAQAS